jgi:hypothetical protein
MAAALRALQTLDQLPKPAGGLKAKFGAKQCLVPSELAHRLRLVTLGQVHLDESGTTAFPEWLCPHGRAGGAGGFPPAAKGDEAASQCFQGMQP